MSYQHHEAISGIVNIRGTSADNNQIHFAPIIHNAPIINIHLHISSEQGQKEALSLLQTIREFLLPSGSVLPKESSNEFILDQCNQLKKALYEANGGENGSAY